MNIKILIELVKNGGCQNYVISCEGCPVDRGNCSIKLNPLITTCDECRLDGSQKCGLREITVELIMKKLKKYTEEQIFEALL